ncbi:Structural maintenance of chromosomes protein 5, partial [Globisporangium splendens]
MATTAVPLATDVAADAASCGEYVDGSIFRVKLHNFLTYTDAEFFPGPRLNLILGPNGTGKSSIVCALCVGLAGSTKLLGRADKVGQFVRHEKESGYTEIELYFESGNKVVRRNIYRDNKSSWMLNGRDSTLKQITGVMEAAKIQIDNLCQFLPQDKVGEFSRMNPVQLLKATETAIMDGDLATTHDKIIELQRDMTDKERELEGVRSSLELKKSENRQREKEVERIVDYESRIKETDLMEKKCLWLEFEEMKREVEGLKGEKKRCHDEMDKAKEEMIAPLEDLLEKETIKLEKTKAEKTEMERTKRQLEEKLKREKQQVETMEISQSKTLSEVSELRNQHNLSKRKLERLEADLTDWKKERAEMPAEASLKEQKVDLERAQRAKELEHAEISSKREARARELVTTEDEIRKVKYKLSKLEDEDVQRRLALQRVDPDSIRAADWVKHNQHKLKRKVWGPVVLEMQVNEALHAKYLEDTLPKWLMAALVTECYEDYNTIIRELNSEGSGQRVKASVLIVQDGKCNPVNRPFTDEQLDTYRREYGISGFLDELVNAPDVIHEVLRAHGGIHTVLVGTRQTEDIINRGGNIFAAIASPERKAAFVTPYKKYVTSVSKYGDRNVTTRTNDLQNPRLLAASSSNEDEKHQMKTILDKHTSRLAGTQEEINALKSQERSFAEERNKSSHRITEIRSQLKAMMRMDEKIAEAENKVYSLRSELARDLSEKEDAMIRKLKGQATKQARHIKECLRLTKDLLVASARDASLALRVGAQQVRAEFTAKQLKRAEHMIRELQEAYKRAKDNLMSIAKKAMQLKRQAEEEAPWDEYEEAFAKLSDDLEDLRGCIENNKASLDCFRGDISVREIYQRVAAEIEREEADLQELEDVVNNGEDKVSAIKESWHAQLKEVVSQIDSSFKEFFKDIGCVGEIVLDDEDTDIAKWGIQRRAQFRKNTKLTTMTAEEQSGGEKSVGTIMYLMALQSLTKCPFRVVDEINQGMDVYNERKVFQRITKSSCGSKLPQYFLITPKLITGLQYHRDTKVMVILNGPWNKIRQEYWDAKKFVACGRQLKRSGGGATASSPSTTNGPPAKKRRIKAEVSN